MKRSTPRARSMSGRIEDRRKHARSVSTTALLLALFALLVPARVGAQTANAGTPAADPADVATPEAIVEAMYESVQRRPGEDFDWDRMRTLFLPTGILIPSLEQTGGEFRVISIEEFIAWIDGLPIADTSAPDDPGFEEEQVAYRVERYGDIAQVFSTYEARAWGESEVLARGINAIQLVHNDGRWWVASVAWDEEIGAGPLPERYLPR